MTRTTAREIAILLGFSLAATGEDPETCLEQFFEPEHYTSMAAENPVFSQRPDPRQMDYIRTVVSLTAAHRQELDQEIETYARGWTAKRVSRTAAAILRCAMCEIRWLPDVPVGAAINEAVELAKKYESPDVVAFINGVLGSFVRSAEGGAEPGGEVPPETGAEQ